MKSLYNIYLWVIANPGKAVMVANLILGFFEAMRRSVPTATWKRWEIVYPRVCALLCMAGAVGNNFAKFARLVFTAYTGKPWPSPSISVPIEIEGESNVSQK